MASEQSTRIGILIVEDDDVLARTLGRYVALFARPLIMTTARQARETLREEPDIAAGIFDVGLPDENGLDLIAEVRRNHPRLPVLVLTGQLRPDYVNRAAELGARFVSKYDEGSRIAHIVMQFAQAALPDDERLTLVIADFCRTHGLTREESEIVRCFVMGAPREELAVQTRTNENTLKSRVRAILRKSRARSLEEIFRHLFFTALGSKEPKTRGASSPG